MRYSESLILVLCDGKSNIREITTELDDSFDIRESEIVSPILKLIRSANFKDDIEQIFYNENTLFIKWKD